MEKERQKIQFIKKIVDYVYPNMVLYKVRQEKKRISKAKSLEFKYPRSRINLLNLKEEQKSKKTIIEKQKTKIIQKKEEDLQKVQEFKKKNEEEMTKYKKKRKRKKRMKI